MSRGYCALPSLPLPYSYTLISMWGLLYHVNSIFYKLLSWRQMLSDIAACLFLRIYIVCMGLYAALGYWRIRSLDWSPRYRETLYEEYAPTVICLYVHTCVQVCVQATVALSPLHSLCSAHLVITLNHIPLSHIYCFLVWFREELYDHTGPRWWKACLCLGY